MILVWESDGFDCRKPEAMRSCFAKPGAFQGRRKVEEECGRTTKKKEITTKTELILSCIFPTIFPLRYADT